MTPTQARTFLNTDYQRLLADAEREGNALLVEALCALASWMQAAFEARDRERDAVVKWLNENDDSAEGYLGAAALSIARGDHRQK